MPNEIVEIQLDQILLNDTNPRGLINPAVVEALSLSMAIEGQKTEIKIRRLNNNQYQVVGGDHRVLAARKLGWTTIQAKVLDITPDQAYLEGYLDNQSQPMGWFADYMAIEALWNQTNKAKGAQKAVADRLMKSEAIVSMALKLMALLNTDSREAILQQLKNGGEDWLTQRAVYPLTNLSTGQPNDPDRVAATLKVLLDRKMTEPHAKALVAWVKAGNPADTYNHQPTPKVKTTLAHATDHPAMASAQAANQPHPEAVTLPAHQASASPKASGPAGNIPARQGSVGQVFLELLAGISVFSHIRSKIKKNEKLTVWEVIALVARDLGRALGWLSKHGFKLIGHILKFVWKLLLAALKSTAKMFGETFYKIARLAVIIGILCGMAWFGWDIYHHGLFHPFRVIGSKFAAKATPVVLTEANPITPAVPTPSPEVTGILSTAVTQQASVSKNQSVSDQQETSNPVPTAQPTAKPKTDVAGDILKQAGPGVAGDVAKKLFGL